MRTALLALLVTLLTAGGCSSSTSPGVATTFAATVTTGAGGTTHAGGGDAGGGGAGGEGPGGQGAGGGIAGGGQGGAGGSGGSAEPRIVAGATDGQLALPFTFGATGQGTSDIGAVSLDDGAGTVQVKGHDVASLAYQRQPFGQWTLYQVLGVETDRLWVLWLYCNQGSLQFVYLEGTDGTPMHYEQAMGTCAEPAGSSAAHAVFPAVDMPLPTPLAGYTLTGPDISLPGAAPGHVKLGAQDLVLLAFEDVDCTQNCGTPGWREIHTLLWDPEGKRVCFAIIYLFQPGQPLLIEYSLTLPDLTDPAGQTQLDATFTTP